MASEAAALLDELMGSQRNALPGEKVRETRWSDPEVNMVLCMYSHVYSRHLVLYSRIHLHSRCAEIFCAAFARQNCSQTPNLT